jgi:hypothetical protein
MRSRARTLTIGVMVAVAVIAVSVFYSIATNPHQWVRVTSTAGLADRGVVFSAELNAFVVSSSEGPLVLSARVPHEVSDYVQFCPRSGLFESDYLAAKFDRFGVYYGGPATRSLDRLESEVEDGIVYVHPGQVTRGPARGVHEPVPPQGQFCIPT